MFCRCESVEARGDETVQRRREFGGCALGLLLGHCREFLDEERVPTRAVAERRSRLRGEIREQLGEQRVRLRGVEWIEMDVDHVVSPGGRRPFVGELTASCRQQDGTMPGEALQEPRDEGEELGVGPMQVRQDQHERSVDGQRREERESRALGVVTGSDRVDGVGVGVTAHQGEQPLGQAGDFGARGCRQNRLDGVVNRGLQDVGVVVEADTTRGRDH